MTMTATRDKRRERMRGRILAAAMRLFVKQGFHNVSLRGVAAAIGYSPAAIYRYFNSKREILAALRIEGFAMFVERQRQAMELADPHARLLSSGLDYLRFARTHPGYFHLMFNLDIDVRDMEDDWVAKPMESYELLRKMAGDCIEAGYFQGHSSEAVVMGLWAAAHGLANLLLSGRVEAMAGDNELWDLLEKTMAFNLRSPSRDPEDHGDGDASKGRETAPRTRQERGARDSS